MRRSFYNKLDHEGPSRDNQDKQKRGNAECTPEKDFMCKICDKAFHKKHNLNNHMQRIHSSNKPYACNLCKRRFSYRKAWETHTESHRFEKIFSCEICGKISSSGDGLKKHIMTHTNERPHSCTKCGAKFRFKWILRQHLRTLHSDRRQFTCAICNRGYENEQKLMIHTENDHKEGSLGELYLCEHCGREFSDATRFQTHKVVCDAYSETFEDQLRLESHVKTRLNEKPFMCNICGNEYKFRHDLNNHMENHIDNQESLLVDIGGQVFDDTNRLTEYITQEESREVSSPLPGFGERSGMDEMEDYMDRQRSETISKNLAGSQGVEMVCGPSQCYLESYGTDEPNYQQDSVAGE
ncbi:hypothetical protein QAD02_000853 [Eretmocerus hayati]|uniref:Uncharacterized protein n=1 Tax=Eretmocerus hayati TaxID=131215 RepID=A0ACC2NED0_9HYME|nr:hypothetical protein QAD02_000853 [Eretmocerus hayati]